METQEVAQSDPASFRADEIEVRSLHPWRMSVVGSPEKGFELHRRLRERPLRLKGKTLDAATAEAVRALVAAKSQDDLFKRPNEPPAAERAGVIYFIGGDVGGVKIGFAVNPDVRLRALQCGSPIRLRILATVAGKPKDERAYHKRFSTHRLHGEWFERSPEVEAEIARLTHLPPIAG